ncbi:MAG: beta-ketoacyl synthase N-terminal-like domain-containing protein, partial [Thermoanaerobaculia bacterium]|nr:beta-ketoacyl synthase N-terminal-like domain-containing protein [Thermoanaerobaculia bacterium]
MSDRSREVVVTGIGLISPAGDCPERVHGFLAAGGTALAPAVELEERGLPPLPAAPLREFDATVYLGKRSLRPLDRTARLAASAAQRALETSGLDGSDPKRPAGLVLGTMFGSIETISEFDYRAVSAGAQYAKPMQFANSVINAAAGQTAIWHRLAGLNATISGGAVSGLQAIGYAADQIRAGRANALLAGGAEELCFPALYGFYRQGRFWNGNGTGPCAVPFDRRRNGMAPSEGAALLVLESRESAEGRGARPLAVIRGHGAGFDPSRGARREGGRAAIAGAIRQALSE